MAKGDDFRAKKKNKAIRKKLSKDPSSVSTRVASLIAAKKRRQSGKRRQCQGMCFSLPTAEDPYNERHGKQDISTGKSKRSLNNKRTLKDVKLDVPKAKRSKLEDCTLRTSGCPSKFLTSCLNCMRDSLLVVGLLREEQYKYMFVDSWGLEFWTSYSMGKDILEKSGTGPSAHKLVWVASAAADSLSQKEMHGISFTTPFLLYLVSSKEKASQVRMVFKSLKSFGLHTVSLHPGTPVELQVQGLKTCEPEFLISTPERLRELVSIKAVDISGVELMVVDGDLLSNCLDAVKCIKNSINGKPCTMVFQGHSGGSYPEAVKSILRKPFHTLIDKPEQ